MMMTVMMITVIDGIGDGIDDFGDGDVDFGDGDSRRTI
jgi:hypothetical protein